MYKIFSKFSNSKTDHILMNIGIKLLKCLILQYSILIAVNLSFFLELSSRSPN